MEDGFLSVKGLTNVGVDYQLIREATSCNLPVRGLETRAGRNSASPELSEEEKLRDLTRSLQEVQGDAIRRSLTDALNAFSAGDRNYFEKAAADEKRDEPEKYAENAERTRAMFAAFKQMTAVTPSQSPATGGPDKPCVAIGTGHLFGDDGFLKLLEGSGFAVEDYIGKDRIPK